MSTVSVPIGEWGRMCGALEVVPDVTQTTFDVIIRKARFNAKLKATNAELLEALMNIADTSPNWMRGDAVADSERRMRGIAQEAIRKAKEK